MTRDRLFASERRPFATDHRALLDALASTDNLLIVQDLDGVCMGLKRDPLDRRLDRRYLDAARRLAGHFYVLTNGEHIGARGVNAIVERTLGGEARRAGLYLPGLAAGGVQWQDRFGRIDHPGVSEAELAFLHDVPDKMRAFLAGHPAIARFPPPDREALVRTAVLDNRASPTLNLNGFYQGLAEHPATWRALQKETADFMASLLTEAPEPAAFFIHYAPNAGRDERGRERLRPGDEAQSGTTDFQLMLSGAVKEAGVLSLLNRHIHERTGRYPLGAAFNARRAPSTLEDLLALARERIAPADMPTLVGVGDTLTSTRIQGEWQRGGSDRGFLTLIQRLGEAFKRDNRVLFVDSSAGEVRRPGVDAEALARSGDAPAWHAFEGITDADDPLRLDALFLDGYTEYVDFFCALAERAPSGTPS